MLINIKDILEVDEKEKANERFTFCLSTEDKRWLDYDLPGKHKKKAAEILRKFVKKLRNEMEKIES